MPDLSKTKDEDILLMIKSLPPIKRNELYDFLGILLKFSKEKKKPMDPDSVTSPVESTWGKIKLNKEVVKYIAEDKDLEYEFF